MHLPHIFAHALSPIGMIDRFLKAKKDEHAQAMGQFYPKEHWRHAPSGSSKMTIAKNARGSAKRKAKRRARRLGHA